MWTDTQVRGFQPRKTRYRRSEDTNLRGVGRLVLDIQPSGLKHFYFQYFRPAGESGNQRTKRVLLSLGRYKQSPASPGLTLSEARQKANGYSSLLQQGVDVELYLQEQKEVEEQRRRELEAARYRGTFEQLLDSYLAKIEGKASHSRVKHSFKKYVKGPFPELKRKYANEITPGHIKLILGRMIESGITTQTNITRAQLHAAFSHGLKCDHDPRRYEQEGVLFNLTINPVSSIPKQADFDRAGDHVIEEDDIKAIWEGLAEPYFLTGSIIMLALATGQRPGELLRLRQADFHLEGEDKYFTIPAHVSKNRTDHDVPLNSLALEVTDALFKRVAGASLYAFPGIRNGQYCQDRHIDPTTLAREVRQYCADTKLEKFTPRDVRRTWKTLAGKAGISKEIRDRIQNHVIRDVSTHHYDRYDYFKEKQSGLTAWNDHLELIIRPRDNVTRLQRGA